MKDIWLVAVVTGLLLTGHCIAQEQPIYQPSKDDLGVAYVARVIHLWRYGEASAIREQTPYTDPGDSK